MVNGIFLLYITPKMDHISYNCGCVVQAAEHLKEN